MALGLVLSLFIGLSLGLFGGGGSILAVPILTYAVGLEPKSAIAGSLLVIAVTSGTALIAHRRSGLVCWRTGGLFAASGMIGAYAGGRLASFVPDRALLVAFAVMMLATAIAMLRSQRVDRRSYEPPQGWAKGSRILAHGLGVGAITGMIGAGGGFLVVPALVLLSGMPMRRAVATSLLVIALKSTAGLAGYLGHTSVPWNLLLPITAVAALGSVFGATLVKKVPQTTLRRGFAWLIIAVAAFVVARSLPETVRSTPLYRFVFVERWPWWLSAAAMASVVLGLAVADSKQLGVSTGCAELCRAIGDRTARSSWRVRLLLGIVLGGALSALFAGRTPTLSMGGFDQIAFGSDQRQLFLPVDDN